MSWKMMSVASYEWWLERLGPREVGGRYFDDRQQKMYTVEQIVWDEEGWEMSVSWVDGRSESHSRAWDYDYDWKIEG